eukprot:416288_1
MIILLKNVMIKSLRHLTTKKDIISTLIKNATVEQTMQIIKMFGSNKHTISTMLHQNMPSSQIKNVTEILDNAQSDKIEHTFDNSHKSLFDSISKESIFNICEFLDKTSIATFKLTSICNALIVFEVMQCFPIGVLDLNGVIQGTKKNYIDLTNNITVNRIKPFTPLTSLIITYCNRYNIARKDLIIVESTDAFFQSQSIHTYWSGEVLNVNEDT